MKTKNGDERNFVRLIRRFFCSNSNSVLFHLYPLGQFRQLIEVWLVNWFFPLNTHNWGFSPQNRQPCATVIKCIFASLKIKQNWFLQHVIMKNMFEGESWRHLSFTNPKMNICKIIIDFQLFGEMIYI